MKQSPLSSHLTHATGTPVTDNLNIQTAGPRGPAVQPPKTSRSGTSPIVPRPIRPMAPASLRRLLDPAREFLTVAAESLKEFGRVEEAGGGSQYSWPGATRFSMCPMPSNSF
jgi:hypothetical protein